MFCIADLREKWYGDMVKISKLKNKLPESVQN